MYQDVVRPSKFSVLAVFTMWFLSRGLHMLVISTVSCEFWSIFVQHITKLPLFYQQWLTCYKLVARKIAAGLHFALEHNSELWLCKTRKSTRGHLPNLSLNFKMFICIIYSVSMGGLFPTQFCLVISLQNR